MDKQYFIYMLTNQYNTVIYIGVTSNLLKRVYQHKNKLAEGFTKRYAVDRLVYYEVYSDIYDAISREKQLKGGSRKKKVALINSFNKDWRDLYGDL